MQAGSRRRNYGDDSRTSPIHKLEEKVECSMTSRQYDEYPGYVFNMQAGNKVINRVQLLAGLQDDGHASV